MARVLVVEDQRKLLDLLHQGLTEEGFDVLIAESAEAGFYAAVTQAVDVIVLDRLLPGRDGVDVVRELRKVGHRTPVILLTARDRVADRIEGLDAGADDYLVKPFDFGELVARLRALLRRPTDGQPHLLRVDDLEMDLLSRRVVRSGEEIALTPREFELLEYLLCRLNRTVTREELSREVWKEPQLLTNAVDVCVMQVRKKIDRPQAAQLLCTIRGVGYAVREPS